MPFLLLSKLVGDLDSTPPEDEITVSLDGKILVEKSTGEDFKYTFIKSVSATKAEYKEDDRSGADKATFEIIGDKIEIVSILFGSGANGNKVTLTPTVR